MLWSTNELRRCSIRATDGEMGSVHDVLFDDRSWLVRYVVADTGKWLPGRRVLLPRRVLGKPDWRATTLPVELTRREIEDGAGVASDPPLAEDARLRHYEGYTWTSHPWGGFIGQVPPILPVAAVVDPPAESGEPRTHLRSALEILDYRIEARDGRIGHVEDFLLTADDWKIELVTIDTRNWLPGKKVVVPPGEIERRQILTHRRLSDLPQNCRSERRRQANPPAPPRKPR